MLSFPFAFLSIGGVGGSSLFSFSLSLSFSGSRHGPGFRHGRLGTAGGFGGAALRAKHETLLRGVDGLAATFSAVPPTCRLVKPHPPAAFGGNPRVARAGFAARRTAEKSPRPVSATPQEDGEVEFRSRYTPRRFGALISFTICLRRLSCAKKFDIPRFFTFHFTFLLFTLASPIRARRRGGSGGYSAQRTDRR